MEESAGREYLRTFPDFEAGTAGGLTLGLDRVLALLEEVGSPHLRLLTLHLAGTKGKGSTAAMLASILKTAGYSTGLFTQPHLIRVHERFTLNGTQIEDTQLTDVMLGQIKPAIARLAARGITGVQQFEAQVALALLWFEANKADVVVLETGLGGRLDATNVVPLPLATILTPIGHDHMAILGNTLTEIAGEKAAIIKPGVPAISSPQPPEAVAVFEAACRANKSPLLLGGRDWSADRVSTALQGTTFTHTINPTAVSHLGAAPPGGWTDDPNGVLTIPDLHTPLLGAHQASNAATASVAALVAAAHLPKIDLAAVRAGLADVSWPGRLQLLPGSPAILLDGAHTAESAQTLADAVRALFPATRIVLVCGVQRDKDIPAVVAPLAALAEVAVATRAQHPRAAPSAEIADALRAAHSPRVEEAESVASALLRARTLAAPSDLILCAGSLYIVGEALAALEAGLLEGYRIAQDPNVR